MHKALIAVALTGCSAATPVAMAPAATEACAAARLLVPAMKDRDPCFESVSLTAADAVIVAPRHDDTSPLVIGRVRGAAIEWRLELPRDLPERDYKRSSVVALRALANDVLEIESDHVYWGGAGAGHIGVTYRVLDRVHLNPAPRSVLRAVVRETPFEGAGRPYRLVESGATMKLLDGSGAVVATATWSDALRRFEPQFLAP